MRKSRYSSSRQKACQSCSVSKAKCDRQSPRCNRCRARGLTCIYRPPVSPEENTILSTPGTVNTEQMRHSPGSISDGRIPGVSEGTAENWNIVIPGGLASCNSSHTAEESRAGPMPIASSLSEHVDQSSQGATSECLDFSQLSLCCPINVDEIRTRWMDPYIQIPGKNVKNYPPGVLEFMSRVLKAYAGAATRGRGLPFVHPTQMTELQTSSPLITCLSLVRICESPLPGSENAAMAVLLREMETLIESHTTYSNDLSLLAAFQAYLIYLLVLYFRFDEGSHRSRHYTDDFIRRALINLQTIAHSASRQGLTCVADQNRTRPRWEEWIVVEAKRRTLYVMYIFDGVVASRDNLPLFLGTELHGLPVAASKYLWQATKRRDWERNYNVYLAEWRELGPTIDELWPIPDDRGDLSIAKRRSRVDHWLEDVDEFGTMLYAVTACTHEG